MSEESILRDEESMPPESCGVFYREEDTDVNHGPEAQELQKWFGEYNLWAGRKFNDWSPQLAVKGSDIYIFQGDNMYHVLTYKAVHKE